MKYKYYIETEGIPIKELEYKSILEHNKELQEVHNKIRREYDEWIYLSCNNYINVDYLRFSCSADSIKGIKLGRDSLELYINELRKE